MQSSILSNAQFHRGSLVSRASSASRILPSLNGRVSSARHLRNNSYQGNSNFWRGRGSGSYGPSGANVGGAGASNSVAGTSAVARQQQQQQSITGIRALPTSEGLGFLVVTKTGLLSVFAPEFTDDSAVMTAPEGASPNRLDCPALGRNSTWSMGPLIVETPGRYLVRDMGCNLIFE
ncbi:unnamed protein product [Protopolystoma xenopodis]|uniref:Uncharacterized protein n=1 Tax=Protopolystoma xenopodis TaxID=117903 RepID=A0A3S5FEC4_9PLAT|nr:unnamed protein product [Protopolystoma xenopodis]